MSNRYPTLPLWPRPVLLTARLLCAIALVSIGWIMVGQHTNAQEPDCTRAEFEQVVDKAAAALAGLNANKAPIFQTRLRELKAKRGWSHADFIKYGTPFVQDAQISRYDAETAELLSKITDKGEQGAAAATPDCSLLAEVRATMQALVQTQTRKWDHMFAKLNEALKQ